MRRREAGTLERVREAGKLRLGHRVDAPPFSYLDQAGKPAGYSIALCQKIAEAVKTELGAPALAVEYVKVGTVDRFEAVEQGRVDLLCGAATATLERRKTVSFSIPVFPSGVTALLRADSPARLRALLSGQEPPYTPRWRASLGQVLEKRILSAVAGTTAETWLRQRRDALDVHAEIVPVQSYAEGVERVLGRRSAVLFGDRSILLDTVARSEAPDSLVVMDQLYTYEPIALVLSRGDEDFRLLVDRTLSRLYRSGEISTLYTSFFGKPDASAQSFFQLVALPE